MSEMLKIMNKSIVAKTIGLALAAAVVVSVSGLSFASNTQHLTVTVADACGPVVAQVTVVNGPDDGAFGITNSAGQFTFPALHQGVFYLHIVADNHVSQDSGTITLTSDQNLTFNLDRTNGNNCSTNPPPTSGTHQLTINVTDICGPVTAQVTVVNGPDDGAFGITNSAGQFVFPSLHEGVFYLHVVANDHNSQDTSAITLTADQAVNVNLDRTNGNNCSTNPPPTSGTHQLTVNITDICGPVAAQVTVVNGPDDGAFGITNSAGQFVFPSLHEGVFYIHVVSADHTTKDSAAITLTSDQTINLSLDRTNGGCPTNNPLPAKTQVTLTCTGGNSPQVNVNWSQVANQTANTLERKVNGGNFAIIFGDAVPFSQFSYIDHNVSLGNTYSYQVKTDVLVASDLTSITLNAQNCGVPPVVVDHPPQGSLDSATCDVITGWASDQDLPNTPLTVQIYADGTSTTGTLIATVSANQSRSDVGAHAFNITTPASVKNTSVHTIHAYLVEGAVLTELGNSPKSFGPCVTVINHPPQGSFDTATCDLMTGWASDQDTPNTSLVVKLYEGYSVTGTLIATTTANLNRSDVGAHGFQVSTPASLKNTSTHTIHAYLVDSSNNNTLAELGNSPITFGPCTTVINHPPQGSLDTATCDIMTGWASDPDTNDTLTVKIFDGSSATGTLIATTQANQSRSDVGAHAFNVTTPASIKDTSTHTIHAYLVDPSTNSLVELANSPITFGPCVTINHNVNLTLNKQVRDLANNQADYVDSLTANPGDQVQFQIQVTASGNTDATNVVVSDVLPAHLSFVSANLGTGVGETDNSTYSFGTITSGSTKTLVITALVDANSSLSCGTNTFTNTANATSANAGTASDSAAVSAIGTANCGGSGGDFATLSISKLVRNLSQGQSNFVETTNVNAGDSVQFQILVTAGGTSAAQNVVVTDTLPANLTLSSGSLVSNLGTMSVGTSQTLTLTALVSGNSYCSSQNLVNTAMAAASNAASVSDQATVVISGSSCGGGGGGNPVYLTLTKEVENLTQGTGFSSQTSANINDRVEFRLTVRNTNYLTTATNVRIQDFMPAGLTYVPGTFQIDSGAGSGSLFNGSQYLGNLVAQNSRIILFQASVNATGTLTNQAQVSADNTGAVNAQASVVVSQVQGSNVNLILSKKAYNQTQNVDATTTTAQINDVIVYTLTVQNTGNAPATGYVFQDDLADVLQFSQLVDFGTASFNLGSLSLSWPALTIPANATVAQTFSVKVVKAATSGGDNLMTNTFGNTVNVRVPSVRGTFVAPTTGNTLTLTLILSVLTLLGFAAYRQRAQLQAMFQTIRR